MLVSDTLVPMIPYGPLVFLSILECAHTISARPTVSSATILKGKSDDILYVSTCLQILQKDQTSNYLIIPKIELY